MFEIAKHCTTLRFLVFAWHHCVSVCHGLSQVAGIVLLFVELQQPTASGAGRTWKLSMLDLRLHYLSTLLVIARDSLQLISWHRLIADRNVRLAASHIKSQVFFKWIFLEYLKLRNWGRCRHVDFHLIHSIWHLWWLAPRAPGAHGLCCLASVTLDLEALQRTTVLRWPLVGRWCGWSADHVALL